MNRPPPSRRIGWCPRWPLATLVLVLACACARAEEREAAGMAVSVVPVRKSCFHDRLVGSGTVVARREAQVRAPRDGFLVDQILVGAGDAVAADQALARLVPAGGASSDAVTLKAPIAGTVAAIGAMVGAFVSPGARDPLFRIVGGDGLALRAEFLASQIVRARPGMAVRLHIVGLGDRDGTVASVGTAIDAATQSGVLTVITAEPRLRIGAFARVEVDAGPDCGFAVPLSALLGGTEGSVVAVVRDGRVQMRQVTLGLMDGGSVEIRTGLEPDEVVVSRAGPFLRDGDRVRAVPEAPGPAGAP